jgi:nicotinamide-nucleotide amidase
LQRWVGRRGIVGSMVVYRTPTKNAWLGIDADLLNDPRIGPVSQQVTEALLFSLLERTPEASMVASITGHLGPQAPETMDGVVHLGCCFRREAVANLRSTRLMSPAPTNLNDFAARRKRQHESAEHLIDLIMEQLVRCVASVTHER